MDWHSASQAVFMLIMGAQNAVHLLWARDQSGRHDNYSITWRSIWSDNHPHTTRRYDAPAGQLYSMARGY
ncbi:hypothetical protein K503DRAFT_464190 [Rhizopogon vinicolor AM-OR11-026]|uniref:Uncharacterized protein n=1 Tax=Rhizopogon vinicolor AM-OR11-026 TaxID=1314800 RepID=A0A1B7MNR5_9AGAM|nr:hypothetical protein K503DRAFT_464190 [Rhizopogon vinicolor AM-OR11-026]